ncbi:uncharacterized protein LOC132757742 isoform X2 [Ruditapes philippinarum]|uniref:uncharacterized protein LOC132757742 isoform X2 n=1 Tax=Ruditapes philippinarum TaxID=129788 RepID=UPI00295BC869|nr:uncharacterized protein LOC132757742 isoform X2 [Ruditapes philippinarum]
MSRRDNRKKKEKFTSFGRQPHSRIPNKNTGKEESAGINKMHSTNTPMLPPEFRKPQIELNVEELSHLKDYLQRIGLLPPTSVDDPLPEDTPPSYEETILLTTLKQQKNIREVLKVHGGRLGSIERTVSQTRQVTDQTRELQQNMNERLQNIGQSLLMNNALQMRTFQTDVTKRFETVERTVTETRQNMTEGFDRIEHSIQELHPQTELIVDRVSQRVVETLLQNEPLRVRIQPNEELMKCITDTTPIWPLGHNRMHKCERCNCMRRCNCICHSQNQWRNFEKRRDQESKMHSGTRRNKESSNLQSTKEDIQLLGATGGDPDESPSDDPSSDDDDSNGNNKGGYEKKKKDKRRKTWKIDKDAWLKCIKEGGDLKHQAESLLSERKLPDQIALNAIRSKYAHLSLVISKICDKVCVYIKEKSEEIAHVWAATNYSKDSLPNDHDIVFVVLTTDTTVKINEENFAIYQRYFLQVDETDRNKEIEIMEYNNLPTSEEIEKLEKCLKENAKSLMNNHSNLTRVTASWFRTDRNDTEHLSLRKELCIALYVHIKGYIPVGEKYFPTEIGGFPVVVREGIFTLCKGPNEYHENVKMGCAIGAEMVGTLGAFIEFENDNDLYGLTCAHVVFGHDKLKAILQKGICVFDDGIVVCQPANTNYKPLGKTVAAVYKSGGNGISGMEFTLIRIHQSRWPTEGTFPDDSDYLSAGFGPDTPFEFASGNTLNTRRLPFPLVYKYGCESKLTQGVCRVNGSSVRTLKFQDNILDTELVLHDQIEIMNIESQFALKGDSGALVFIKDENKELSAFGMFEGKFQGTNIYVCTPIYDVLNEIKRICNKQCRFKRFLPSDSQINDPRLHDQLHDTVMSLSGSVSQLHGRLESLDQGFAKHKLEISNELGEYLKRTLEISDQQKIQREELKNQNDELKKQGDEHIKQSQEIKERQERQEKQSEELKEELRRQGDEHVKQSQEIKERQERQEKQSEELKEELRRQGDEHVKQSQEIKQRQERQEKQGKELKEELRRQGDEHVKHSQEIKERQERQEAKSEELKEELRRQGDEHVKQSQEIKEGQERQGNELKDELKQMTQILMLLTQQKS